MMNWPWNYWKTASHYLQEAWGFAATPVLRGILAETLKTLQQVIVDTKAAPALYIVGQ